MNILPKIYVKIGKNLANKADSLLLALGFADAKICVISDEKIWNNSAKFFGNKFAEMGCDILILKDPRPDEKNLRLIENTVLNQKKNPRLIKSTLNKKLLIKGSLDNSPLIKNIIGKNYDLIIGFGSGTINDLCKFSSFKTGVPYIIFASAPSMNGYLSRNASIVVRGHKKTLAATLPLAVYADLDILKSAPKSMIQAGIGDSLCFYSCWFDWLLSHLILGTKFNQKPFEILQKKMEFLIKNYQKFKLDDDKLLQILTEILLLSGTGMTLAAGSYPASQSEHLIGHAFEMKYPKKAHKIFHGLQIAVTTPTAVKLQEKMLAKNLLRLKKIEFPTKKIEKLFDKKIAAECKKEFCEKNNFDLDIVNKRLNQEWKNHRKILQKILLPEKTIQKILKHFQIQTSALALGLSAKQYQELINNAKFIRNRFTCLDLIC